MATSTFDKVFIVRKKADRERLATILNSNNSASFKDLPVYTTEDWKENEALLLECLFHSER